MLRKTAYIALILLAFSGLPPAWAAERAQETAISTIYKDPKRFDGHLLRLRGILNQCYGFNCSLCTAGASDDGSRCVRVEFDETLGGQTLEAAFRLSELTVEGRYSWACDMARYTKDKRYFDQTKAVLDITVCTDRATNFVISSILAVHQRWPATNSTINTDQGAPLEVVPGAQAGDIVSAFNAFEINQYLRIDGTAKAGKDYLVVRAIAGSEPAETRLCQCKTADCTNHWPTQRGHLIETPANPYHCARVERIKGQWRFPPRFS